MKKQDEAMVSPPPKPWDIDCSKDVPLTKQEFVAECDINKIITRCVKMGVQLPTPEAQAVFGDVTGFGDLSESMRRLQAASDEFDTLPAAIRSEFHNSPVELVAFLGDEKNRARAIELGILAKPEVPPAPPVVPPSPAK